MHLLDALVLLEFLTYLMCTSMSHDVLKEHPASSAMFNIMSAKLGHV